MGELIELVFKGKGKGKGKVLDRRSISWRSISQWEQWLNVEHVWNDLTVDIGLDVRGLGNTRLDFGGKKLMKSGPTKCSTDSRGNKKIN